MQEVLIDASRYLEAATRAGSLTRSINRDFINHHPRLRVWEHSYSRALNVGHSKKGWEREVSDQHYHGLHR